MICKRWNQKCQHKEGCGNTHCEGDSDKCVVMGRVWAKRVKKHERNLKILRSGTMNRFKVLALELAIVIPSNWRFR